MSQAGALVRHRAVGFWWANAPKEHWPDHPEWRRNIAKSWDPVYGDRHQEVVFIGTDMDEAAIRRRLDACLIGDANAKAMQPAAWEKAQGSIPGLEAGRAVMTVPSVSLEGESVRTSATLGVSIATCDAAEGLDAINEPNMELVIWRRALPMCLQTWLDRMDAACLPDLRILVRPRRPSTCGGTTFGRKLVCLPETCATC